MAMSEYTIGRATPLGGAGGPLVSEPLPPAARLGAKPSPMVRLGESRVGDKVIWFGQMSSGHFWRQYEAGEVSTGRVVDLAAVQEFFREMLGSEFAPADAPFPLGGAAAP